MIELLDADLRVPDTEESRREIRNMVDTYARMLGLEDWELVLRIYSNGADEDDVASCDAMYETRHVELTFNLAQIPPSQLAWCVLHELLHAVLWPLSYFGECMASTDNEHEWLRLETERVVEHLAQLPIWNAR
jgi:hypothetical protein